MNPEYIGNTQALETLIRTNLEEAKIPFRKIMVHVSPAGALRIGVLCDTAADWGQWLYYLHCIHNGKGQNKFPAKVTPEVMLGGLFGVTLESIQ